MMYITVLYFCTSVLPGTTSPFPCCTTLGPTRYERPFPAPAGFLWLRAPWDGFARDGVPVLAPLSPYSLFPWASKLVLSRPYPPCLPLPPPPFLPSIHPSLPRVLSAACLLLPWYTPGVPAPGRRDPRNLCCSRSSGRRNATPPSQTLWDAQRSPKPVWGQGGLGGWRGVDVPGGYVCPYTKRPLHVCPQPVGVPRHPAHVGAHHPRRGVVKDWLVVLLSALLFAPTPSSPPPTSSDTPL